MITRVRNLILIASIINGCSSAPKRSGAPVASPARPPTSPANAPAPPTPPSAPVAAATPAHRVAVVLGPGGAKALAHVGILRALQRRRVPIDKIVGLEWGALVGGIFAHHAQVHDLEWKLYKMEQQNLPRPPKGLFGRDGGASGVGVMASFLNDSFGADDVSQARTPFACPARSLWTGVVAWQTRGAFRDVMKRCLTFPPVFKVEGNLVAGASQAEEAIELLKGEGYDVVILVNVLGSGLLSKQEGIPDNVAPVLLWQEIKRSVQRAGAVPGVDVVTVDTSAYPVPQFDAAKALVQLGETAGAAAATRLIGKYGF